MPEEPENACRGILDQRVAKLLAACGCRLVKLEDLIQSIHDAGRGKRIPWLEKWVNEEGPEWVNDMDTFTFDFPAGGVTGQTSLEFTQGVWMLQPSVFEYQVWSGRCFVRMWWDPIDSEWRM
jgi:hypothetical protein